MKFIFPQNYHFKNKIFGVIDYTTAFVNLIWYGLVFLIVNILFSSISVKVVIFILLCFPLLLFSFSGFNGENIVYVFIYMTKYIFRQNLYLYGKNRKKI